MEDPWWPETFFFFITEAFWAWPETGKERLSWIERGEEENEMWQIAQSDSYSWFLFDSWLAFHGGYWNLDVKHLLDVKRGWKPMSPPFRVKVT